jgi:hypothetical protein
VRDYFAEIWKVDGGSGKHGESRMGETRNAGYANVGGRRKNLIEIGFRTEEWCRQSSLLLLVGPIIVIANITCHSN